MWRMLIPALLLGGCAQLPPTPEDIQAKRFEVPPDKSVIYVVRPPVDSYVLGDWQRGTVMVSALQPISDNAGRNLVVRGQLLQ